MINVLADHPVDVIKQHVEVVKLFVVKQEESDWQAVKKHTLSGCITECP